MQISVAKQERPLRLKVSNLSITYKTPRGILHAVRNASFEAREKENIVFIGESGCGKTTLCTSLVGMQPINATPISGTVKYLGEDREYSILEMSDKQLSEIRWKDIAMMFQASQNAFNPVILMKEHFVDTAQSHLTGQSRKTILDKSRKLLELVRLDADRVLNSYPHELSGGMKQRALLALSFLLDPKVIIFDEPTTALDVLTQRYIIDILRDLREQFAFCMLFITHDLSIAAELADTVVTMYAGQIVEKAPVREIFRSPKHPYTAGLIQAVPTLSGTHEDLKSIPGTTPDLVDMAAGCQFAPRCRFATELCLKDEPQLSEVGPNHVTACHHHEQIPPIVKKG